MSKTDKASILKDLKKQYKELLTKHLNKKTFNKDEAKSWLNTILTEARDYFTKKYPNYAIFLFNYIKPRTVNIKGLCNSISSTKTDICDFVDLKTDNLYSVLYFFPYMDYKLSYSLDDFEDEIIQNGNEILKKYLDNVKYESSKMQTIINNINDDHIDFILEKESNLRAFFLTEIYENPIKEKYFFKYLSYGKDINTKIYQTYINESLTSCHYVFFFK